MASKQFLRPLLSQPPRSSTHLRRTAATSAPRAFLQRPSSPRLLQFPPSRRWKSHASEPSESSESNAKAYGFEDVQILSSSLTYQCTLLTSDSQIKSLISSPSPSRILIGTCRLQLDLPLQPQKLNRPRFLPLIWCFPPADVREPHEISQTGKIPTAHNVPIASSPDALFLPADDFLDKFGFEKPKHDAEVVFYCKAGVRSRTAAQMAKMAGWDRVGEYWGSWLDWERCGGKIEKGG